MRSGSSSEQVINALATPANSLLATSSGPREMQGDSRVFVQPGGDAGVRVGGVVVADDVSRPRGSRHTNVEFLAFLKLVAMAQHRAPIGWPTGWPVSLIC